MKELTEHLDIPCLRQAEPFIWRGFEFSRERLQLISRPCAVESREQIRVAAETVAACGGRVLRGGTFKLRTSPYDFQGLGEEGLILLREASDEFGLLACSELTSEQDLDLMRTYLDIIQIGERNARNYRLLQAAATCGLPVIYKRGQSQTLAEWLAGAEYFARAGQSRIIFCERGIRTFEPWTRNTLDLAAVPVIQRLTRLPVIVDPSHAGGSWDLVEPLAMAAVAAGADGIMLEIHPDPQAARSDARQQLTLKRYRDLADRLQQLHQFCAGQRAETEKPC